MVVPTLGRPTLLRALHALALQLAPDDEILVVADPHGNVGMAKGAFDECADERWRFLTLPAPGNDHGYKARTLGMSEAHGTHLCFADDDDEATPAALATFRANACDRPVFARMKYLSAQPSATGYLLWSRKEIFYGNIGSPMICVPNDPDRLGVWKDHNGAGSAGGDYTFAVGCVREMGAPVWVDEIVCVIRPE